jgi:ubiquinone biosynthesis monooxygenase Coq7
MAEPETPPDAAMSAPEAPRWRPGDEKPDIAAMLRVDQAGEYGATRIYCGQLAVLGAASCKPPDRADAVAGGGPPQDLRRDDGERGVRPTLLQPIWRVAGHALGATTALMSPNAAMACTAAVETEIDRHYSEQLRALGADEPELAATIGRFRDEELEHRDTALAAGAEDAFGYPLLSSLIRAGCRIAIALSKRI